VSRSDLRGADPAGFADELVRLRGECPAAPAAPADTTRGGAAGTCAGWFLRGASGTTSARRIAYRCDCNVGIGLYKANRMSRKSVISLQGRSVVAWFVVMGGACADEETPSDGVLPGTAGGCRPR
jgi:hypothetical protein